ncbi:hypothetical protein [Halapricum desulfuricans]|uniref:hypothetical protein n=1 Tax=Halapricum desulfuricans TaxID=2841257 RepID=UPI001E42666D|nr:hypothetical protein [Halapricum desulfuricans]
MPGDSSTTEPDLEEIHEEVTEITAIEITEPTDAHNERDNPEVSVAVQQFGRTIEHYTFEFVRPSQDTEYPRYRLGPFRVSEKSNQTQYQNNAMYEAAKALAEYTKTPVRMEVKPDSEIEDQELKSYSGP